VGPIVGDWLIELPLISGPVSFFLALEQGKPFRIRSLKSNYDCDNLAFVLAYTWRWNNTSSMAAKSARRLMRLFCLHAIAQLDRIAIASQLHLSPWTAHGNPSVDAAR
jgi:hypothetical protein